MSVSRLRRSRSVQHRGAACGAVRSRGRHLRTARLSVWGGWCGPTCFRCARAALA